MTYRDPVDSPVCASCKHRADAMHMNAKEPWRDWLCLATPKVIWHAEYNPITGVSTPAKMGHERCAEVNSQGNCTKFEHMPAPPEPRITALLDTMRAGGQQPDAAQIVLAETSPKPRRWWWPWKRVGM